MMKRLFARYADVMDSVSVFIGHGCSVLFFACIAVSALEVVMRYGFDSPTVWSTELAMTLCASAWVLAVGYVTQRHRHISITMIETLVSPRVWRVMRLLQMVIAAGAVLVLTMALWDPMLKVLKRTEHSGTALNSIQPTYLKILLVAGCILYILQLAANIIRWCQRTEGEIAGGH
ncbi:TRAP transporter small permease subunit [Roseibium aggregatum]|uniref:TRAP transporter small permease subunit n=2 Tax=Stappiaceae TaxID=2821832 RepID=UPI001E4FC0B5|nr:TRAP transporter small permease [Roseibium aggregatum]UES49891.1 TRAP transporter small permease subunit [Roseibium aggregatum]